jgi:site-specific DNA-methyltransferase (adenine-specific)/modification methylase
VSLYYAEPGIEIHLGDCREVLPTLGKFDLLLTDPPWGKGLRTDYATRRGAGASRMPHCHRGGALRNDFEPVAGDDAPFDPAHLLGLTPSAILWGANHYASRLPDSPCWLAWDRESDGNDATDVELAWVAGHRFTTVRIFRHVWCGVRRKTEAGPRHKYVHPTQKPVALMRWCLSFFPDARTVVDPYMGSGPVARACKDAGLRYVGIELVEKYCEIAANRLRQEVLFGAAP